MNLMRELFSWIRTLEAHASFLQSRRSFNTFSKAL
jgi:hypothetical protein